ncbi:MAG: S-methyl-5'-thioadenosine phosphorylase [Gemmatimonadetes bacterium]|nr:S-methyl-5'-thioadenosine phosphorylase [Gemmatimonadota bacterium]
MSGVEVVAEHDIETPFGKPSDMIVETRIECRSVYFLPRHGRGHIHLPSEIPNRANIFALKTLGVTHVLGVSAVGIMQEHILPGDMIVPDQLFDRTRGLRDATFFGDGIVGHVMFADPFCDELRAIAIQSAKDVGVTVHDGGSYVCMEGPQFSTRAESHFYRKTLKPSVIGMTAIPEAKLAREAEMCYAIIATGTDYDCWHEGEEDVTVEAIIEVLHQNADMAKAIVKKAAGILPETSSCECLSSAEFAIITAPDRISEAARERLKPLYGHYWE